ncbi:FGGY family carbohydrate kinase [Chelativorans sp. AA-79]|uniref:FGGY family carbohydrate kinase n=1 Tax=Chelativorans sp. AA-79 TaxID=3028735 RepID=UPI0023F660DC|nr:FGGY family carbohydrate kinase [Chelativorans sp. AA-79]WEX11156.1 FGGY family carbohydrate kinase [Chelativorans sp. AA-79]
MSARLLCLDSGTTTVKAAAFDAEGRVVATAQRDNSALQRDGARVEQDMQATLDDAFAVLAECARRLEGPIEGLIITGQGDGLWPIDTGGRAVGNAITWLDGRTRALATALQRAGRLEAVEAVTSAQPTAASQSLHLLWLQDNDTARLERIAHALRCKEWLFHGLTGRVLAEPTALLPTWGDWRTGETSAAVEEALGLRRGVALLPELAPIGDCRAGLSKAAADRTGIAEGTPVLLGPGDVQSALTGLGLGSRPGVTRASIFGTSAIHACHMDDPGAMREKPPGAIIQPFALTGGYLCFHPSFNGAALCAHVARLTGSGAAGPSQPAYSGVLLHPFLEPGGERAPVTAPHASGAIFGLTAASGPREIAWAALEALAFVACKSHEMMNAPEGDLSLGGGLSGDANFTRFLATVLGRKVQATTGGLAGLRGLAAIAAKHLYGASPETLARDWIVAPDTVVAPEPGAVGDYAAAKYRLFSRLLDMLQPSWQDLSAIADLAVDLPREHIA